MIKMSGVIRSSLKLYPSCGFMSVFRQTIKPENAKQRLYSTLWNSSTKCIESNALKSTAVWNKCSSLPKHFATRSESELSDFLEQEIGQEQKIQKHKTIPSKIDDFEVKLDGSEVTLEKSSSGETITVSFNINQSLDMEGEGYEDSTQPEEGEYNAIVSKPQFNVEIQKGDTTLAFTCSFEEAEAFNEDEEMAGDVFRIDDVSLYKGEWKETNYEVNGSVLDGQLYDLLMNFLEEKGISNEFAIRLSELSTAYEHSNYISLLRELKNFTSK